MGASTELALAFECPGLRHVPAPYHATSWLFDEPGDAMYVIIVPSFYDFTNASSILSGVAADFPRHDCHPNIYTSNQLPHNDG